MSTLDPGEIRRELRDVERRFRLLVLISVVVLVVIGLGFARMFAGPFRASKQLPPAESGNVVPEPEPTMTPHPELNAALLAAAREGNYNGVQGLLAQGAYIDTVDDHNRTPLAWAVSEGHAPIVKLLLDRGASMTILPSDSRTMMLLHIAAAWGHADVAEALLDAGAEVDAKTDVLFTPLRFAAQSGHDDVVELLLQRGADPNARDTWGWAPLHLAAGNGHVRTVELLVENGADVRLPGMQKSTPLHNAAAGSQSSGGRTFVKDGKRVAAGDEHVAIARFLLDKGAEVDAVSEHGATPLIGAAVSGNVDMVSLLLDRGANVNANGGYDGTTALHQAAARDDLAVAELLIERGADVNAPNARGETPLRYAHSGDHGDSSVAQLLKKHGAVEKLEGGWH